jgi:hypothetical protein
MWCGWSTPRPGRFTTSEDPVPIVHEEGWGPRGVWTGAQNLIPTRIRSPDRPARSESLYWLSDRGPSNEICASSNSFFTFLLPCCVVTNCFIIKSAFGRDQVGTAVPFRSYSIAVYKPVWHIALLSVQWINCWWWTWKLSETCWLLCQNEFVKLVDVVGFIIKKSVKLFYWRQTMPNIWTSVSFDFWA